MGMRKIRIQMLAHSGAGQEVYDQGLELLEKYVPGDTFFFTHTNPDVLFFITGGSEKHAIDVCAKLDKVMLWSHDGNNAHAAATEVKAYLNNAEKLSNVWNIQDKQFPDKVHRFQSTLNVLNRLNDSQLGLIGRVSDWLVASEISEKRLREVFGIFLVPIAWDALKPYHKFEASSTFDWKFKTGDDPELKKASQVHSLMDHTIKDNHLDAVTVECFPLVKQHGVTACLSMALLNDKGVPAGCEGDLTSITGMLFAKALVDEIPWMANTVKVEEERVRFAHCTIPRKMVRDYTIMSHFETGMGTAIQGELNAQEVTVFRFDNALKRFFLTVGQVISRPKLPNACRTQVEIELPGEDITRLKETPLGNHHLLLSGDHSKIINLAARWYGLKPV